MRKQFMDQTIKSVSRKRNGVVQLLSVGDTVIYHGIKAKIVGFKPAKLGEPLDTTVELETIPDTITAPINSSWLTKVV